MSLSPMTNYDKLTLSELLDAEPSKPLTPEDEAELLELEVHDLQEEMARLHQQIARLRYASPTKRGAEIDMLRAMEDESGQDVGEKTRQRFAAELQAVWKETEALAATRPHA